METVNTTNSSNIFIDYKTGTIIIAKKMPNNSYSYYSTKIGDDGTIQYSDFSNLTPIDDIFDYIEQHDIEINILPDAQEISEKKYGSK